MNKIIHDFQIEAPPENVFNALISGEKISKWWTKYAQLNPKVGDVGAFEWPNHGWRVRMKLQNLEQNSFVEWVCIESNMQNTDAWTGTTLSFSLRPNGQNTTLHFCQSGYIDSPCKEVCTEGWGFVLGKSLKAFLETGKGVPYQ